MKRKKNDMAAQQRKRGSKSFEKDKEDDFLPHLSIYRWMRSQTTTNSNFQSLKVGPYPDNFNQQ